MYRINIPATSANLGPGFDCLGMAVSLYNTVEFAPARQTQMTILGEDAQSIPRDARNLVRRAYKRALQEMGHAQVPLSIRQINQIPATRGLGSSASAVVAGILMAQTVAGEQWPKSRTLALATLIEGHPDNVAPAIYGGFTVSVQQGKDSHCLAFAPPKGLIPVAMVPDFELSTQAARNALPPKVNMRDAVFNLSHAAFLTAAFAKGDLDALQIALEDRLHQPYRAKLVPGMKGILAQAKTAGALGAFLSGAGPTLMALCREEHVEVFCERMQAFLKEEPHVWRILPLQMDTQGATVQKI